jgi:hypothetical protein
MRDIKNTKGKWKMEQSGEIKNKVLTFADGKDEITIFKQEGYIQLSYIVYNGATSGSDYPESLQEIRENLDIIAKMYDLKIPKFKKSYLDKLVEAEF